MSPRSSALKTAALSCAFLSTSACLSIAAIEPVSSPPVHYQADVVVKVEFIHPSKVGQRCAERGVSAFGVPVSHAMACANRHLITVPNPCDTVTAGWYAAALCSEIAHSRGWEAAIDQDRASLLQSSSSGGLAPGAPSPQQTEFTDDTTLRIEFVDASVVGLRCGVRGGTVSGEPTLNALSCASSTLATVPNPCSVPDGGWYAGLLCHEIGHVNGWPQSHAGGSYFKGTAAGASVSIDQHERIFGGEFLAAVQAARRNLSRGDPVRATVASAIAGDSQSLADIRRASGASEIRSPEIIQPPSLAEAAYSGGTSLPP